MIYDRCTAHLRRRQGQNRLLSFLAGVGRERTREDIPPARQHPHRARIGAAQLRRQEGRREGRRDSGQLERQGARAGGDSLRRRAHRAAGLHRRAAPRRSRRDARRGRHAWQRSQDRSSRSCRWISWSITRCRWISSARAEALQHESRHRVQAQPRALPIPQVGPAGVRDLRRRAARHRHRPPGESRIPRQGRA